MRPHSVCRAPRFVRHLSIWKRWHANDKISFWAVDGDQFVCNMKGMTRGKDHVDEIETQRETRVWFKEDQGSRWGCHRGPLVPFFASSSFVAMITYETGFGIMNAIISLRYSHV